MFMEGGCVRAPCLLPGPLPEELRRNREELRLLLEPPRAPCPEGNSGRWWQDRRGHWWYERCHPHKPSQWVRLVTLPLGEHPTPAPVVDEEVENAVAVAAHYGWSRGMVKAWCGGDWSGLPEPEYLEPILRTMAPR